MKPDNFAGGNSSHCHHLAEKREKNEETQPNFKGSYLRCDLFRQRVICHKMQMRYSIALKFGTQKGGIMEHHGTKFGCNTVNGHTKL